MPACATARVVDRADDGTAILICAPQPDAEALRRSHRRHGTKTVINLRGEKPEEAWFLDERRGVEEIGARWIHLPIGSREGPPPEVIARFFDLVEDRANWPVYVHCQSGIHRTGILCALYRMQYQGWSGEDAVKEMEQNGFDWGRGDRGAAKEFVRGYGPDPARRLSR